MGTVPANGRRAVAATYIPMLRSPTSHLIFSKDSFSMVIIAALVCCTTAEHLGFQNFGSVVWKDSSCRPLTCDVVSGGEAFPRNERKMSSFTKTKRSTSLSLKSNVQTAGTQDGPVRDLAFSGEHQDAQWRLTIQNFRGKWQGDKYVYNRRENGGLGDIDFSQKSSASGESCFEITFSDDLETGQWKGSGLRFTQGVKILPLSRKGYNAQGMAWQFPGMGGQGSRHIAPGVIPADQKFHHEINFFHDRTRSMIVVSYGMAATDAKKITLDSVGITTFRCQHGCTHGPREKIKDVDTLLTIVEKFKGTRMSFGPDLPLDENKQMRIEQFDPSIFSAVDANVKPTVFEDNVVMAVPDVITEGNPFRFVFGCLQSPEMYKQLIIAFDSQGQLQHWTYDTYTP